VFVRRPILDDQHEQAHVSNGGASRFVILHGTLFTLTLKQQGNRKTAKTKKDTKNIILQKMYLHNINQYAIQMFLNF
jgi:hypothetical protein